MEFHRKVSYFIGACISLVIVAAYVFVVLEYEPPNRAAYRFSAFVLLLTLMVGLTIRIVKAWSEKGRKIHPSLIDKMLGVILTEFLAGTIVVGAIAGFIVLAIINMALIKQFDSTRILLTKNGQLLRSFEDPKTERVFWRNDPLFVEGYKAVSIAQTTLAYKREGPKSITTNPQVIEMKYELVITRLGTKEAFFAEQAACKRFGHKNMREHITYWMIKFNNEHSKELAQLNNPLEMEYVKKFSSLLESFMKKPLQAIGAQFVEARMIKRLATVSEVPKA